MQLASSLVVLNTQLVLSGSLLLPRYACTLGPSGWVGFGLPKDQASTAQMVGAKVLFIRPAPNTPTGEGRVNWVVRGKQLWMGPPTQYTGELQSEQCASFLVHVDMRAGSGAAVSAACWPNLPPRLAVARLMPIHAPTTDASLAGGTVYARLLNGTSPTQFKPATGLLARTWTLK